MISRAPSRLPTARLATTAGVFLAAAAFVHCSSSPSSGSPTDACAEMSCAMEGPDGSVGASHDGGVSSDSGGHPNDGSAGQDGSTMTSPDGSMPPPVTGALPRMVAYVNVTCGFGVGSNGGECLADPDPTVNYVKQWEDEGSSPITHYVLSFLSFQGTSLQTDPGEIWKTGASTSDFTLVDGVREALVSAHAKGKKVMLSVGGENGSTGFLAWWNALGGTSGVGAMGTELQRVATAFASANGVNVDGFDVDIELGGVYSAGSDKYNSTRDLINAVPESFLVAFVPQIGNGLCAAPNIGDPLPPSTTLGGQCPQPVNGDDSPWALAGLDTDCKRSDGSPKLDYWGIQYYNAGQAACCGGGGDTPSMIQSTVQSYVDLANGWPASGDLSDTSNPWHQYQYFPGPWPAFAGIGADRLVLGKPGCQGCAGSDFIALTDMGTLVGDLDGKLVTAAGGVLFWDLGRLFGRVDLQLRLGGVPAELGGSATTEQNLTTLRSQMAALTTK